MIINYICFITPIHYKHMDLNRNVTVDNFVDIEAEVGPYYISIEYHNQIINIPYSNIRQFNMGKGKEIVRKKRKVSE